MYLDYFGLKEAPFRITPDTEFFFAGANRGETLQALIYAITQGEGLVKVSGEVGSGKTMLSRVLLERLPDTVETIYLAIPRLGRDEVLRAIAGELAVPVRGERPSTLVRELQRRLIELHAEGRQVVVLIDEAHAMPMETLEEIRLLSNLETRQNKLLQIVLFGQPELDRHLDDPDMRQLRERITHSFTLMPLGAAEIRNYLDFRLRAAGYRGPELFNAACVALISRASAGLTRRVNILADKSMLAAFSQNTHTVTARHVRAAIRDSEFALRGLPRLPWAMLGGALAAGLILGGVFTLWWSHGAGEHEAIARSAPPSSPAVPAPTAAPATTPPPVAVAPTPSTTTAPAPPTSDPVATMPAAAYPVPADSRTAAPLPAPVILAADHAATAAPAPTPPQVQPAALAGTSPPPPGPTAPAMGPHPYGEPARAIVVGTAAPATAAQAGTVEATHPAADASDSAAAVLEQSVAWLRAVPEGHFLIQLMLADPSQHDRLAAYVVRAEQRLDPQRLRVCPLRSNGRTWLGVLYGSYADRQEAQRALRALPAELAQYRPYIRPAPLLRNELP